MAGKVALVLGPSTGGIGTHVASLAAGLAGSGVRVAVLGPAATQSRFDFTGRGARFIPVGVSPGGVPGLRRALAGFDPGVVHAHGLRAGLCTGVALPPGPRRRGGPGRAPATPLVVTWHNGLVPGGPGRLRQLVERQVARRADVTLGASAQLVARALAAGGRDVRPGPVAAPELPAAVRDRAAVRAELGLAAGQPLVLSVGRLHSHKGYHVLIAAAARWAARAARWAAGQATPLVVIAGDGPARDRLAALISATRAPVHLLGYRNDIADLLGAADLAVLTSVLEARPLFAQEALRAGVPLVATAVGGLPELAGAAAVLVPPNDVAAVDAAVTALLADPARRVQLARLGRDRAATWPTEEQTVARIRALYTELTGTELTGQLVGG